MNFGHGANGGTRIVTGGFLLDCNRGRQTFDQIDIGFFHQLEKLARIGRQTLDVAALAFGVQRVKSERGFPRTRQASDHHQRVARQIKGNVLEIVGSSAPNANFGGRRRWRDRVVRFGGHIGHPAASVRATCYYSRPGPVSRMPPANRA